jgi:asparagine synthetase B (glutamine-hydrolysing)
MPEQGRIRATLVELVRDISGTVAVATSGGVDSASLVVACLEAGHKPIVASFRLSNREHTYDFDTARKLANKFSLAFLPVILPVSDDIVLDKVIHTMKTLRVKNKAAIECLYPMLFLFDELARQNIQNLVCGHAADGHYGLSKKAMIHYRSSIETFQQFRCAYFQRPNVAQSESLTTLSNQTGVKVHLPYLSPLFFDLFRNLSWYDINTPRQKELIRRDFPELDNLKLKRHLNLQLGDSGIAETVGNAVVRQIMPHAKSPVSAYNLLWRRYEQT